MASAAPATAAPAAAPAAPGQLGDDALNIIINEIAPDAAAGAIRAFAGALAGALVVAEEQEPTTDAIRGVPLLIGRRVLAAVATQTVLDMMLLGQDIKAANAVFTGLHRGGYIDNAIEYLTGAAAGLLDEHYTGAKGAKNANRGAK